MAAGQTAAHRLFGIQEILNLIAQQIHTIDPATLDTPQRQRPDYKRLKDLRLAKHMFAEAASIFLFRSIRLAVNAFATDLTGFEDLSELQESHLGALVQEIRFDSVKEGESLARRAHNAYYHVLPGHGRPRVQMSVAAQQRVQSLLGGFTNIKNVVFECPVVVLKSLFDILNAASCNKITSLEFHAFDDKPPRNFPSRPESSSVPSWTEALQSPSMQRLHQQVKSLTVNYTTPSDFYMYRENPRQDYLVQTFKQHINLAENLQSLDIVGWKTGSRYGQYTWELHLPTAQVQTLRKFRLSQSIVAADSVLEILQNSKMVELGIEEVVLKSGNWPTIFDQLEVMTPQLHKLQLNELSYYGQGPRRWWQLPVFLHRIPTQYSAIRVPAFGPLRTLWNDDKTALNTLMANNESLRAQWAPELNLPVPKIQCAAISRKSHAQCSNRIRLDNIEPEDANGVHEDQMWYCHLHRKEMDPARWS